MPIPKKNIFTAADYWALPEGHRAELIDGDLYDMAPPSRMHQKIVMQLSYAISHYISENNGSCEVYPAPFAVNLNADDSTFVEPDISVICDKDKLSDRGCEGAPDWIIEVVSPSSQKMDYLTKLFKYRTAGVREYWIVDPLQETTQVYFFEGTEDFHRYSFSDKIDAGIYGDLEICISELLK